MSEIQIEKMKYTHDAMVEQILANPSITQRELAALFGYTESWISIVVHSDSFQAKMADMKAVFLDPQLRASIDDRLNGMVMRSIDIVTDKLEATKDASLALKAMELGGKYLGMGQQKQAPQANVYVAVMPPVAPDAEAWRAGSSRAASEALTESPGSGALPSLFADRIAVEDAVITKES